MTPDEMRERFDAFEAHLREYGTRTAFALKGLETRVGELEACPDPTSDKHQSFTVTIYGSRPVLGIRVIYADEEEPGQRG
jgi:hypothetical protein